jgi:hypothetical protein
MTTLQAAIVAILSGNFTTNGNFSGYNSKGQRIHIPGRQMESLGFKTDDEVKGKFPLYSIVVEREFNVLDENGEPKGDEKFTRAQAGSTFLSKADALTAYNSDSVLAIEATAELRKSATAAGLDAKTIAALEAATV